MTDLRQAAQMAREALENAQRTLEVASRILTDAHRIVLNGNHWGESTLKRIPKAIAALTSALEADRWRPIETAPDDGSRILVFDPRLIEAHRVEIRGADGGFWRWNASTGGTNPTHWCPLPPPPQGEK